MIRSTLALAAGMALFGLAAHAETMKFHGTLSGTAEVPPHNVPGTGMVEATLDTTTKKLDYTGTWSGLTGPATAAHFHGPAAPGANAGVVLPWTGTPTSGMKGSATLTDAQIADLEAGKWYANVHTAKNPNGEVRAQMAKQ